jgi:hypothetical protein
VQAVDEFAGVDTEDFRQLEDVVQGGVALSPLDLAEVTPMQARLLRQLLLAPPELMTARADSFAELACRI